MPRWLIEVSREDDEVVVLVERDGKFHDEAGFHPSEKDEITRYLAETLQRIVKEVTISDEQG